MTTLCTAAFARAVGVSYRKSDYWARTGTLRPSVREARGSGSARRYSAHDVAVGRVLAQLADHGATLPILTEVVEQMRAGAQPSTGYLTVTRGGEVTWWASGADALEAAEWTAAWIVKLGAADAAAAAA